MKKLMTLVTLGVVTTALSTEIDLDNPTSVAYWAQKETERQQIWEKAKTDDEALKALIRISYNVGFGSYSTGSLISSAQERAKNKDKNDGGISFERWLEALESMVHEGLFALEKDEKNSQAYNDVTSCALMLGALPDYDVLPLIKKCLQSQIEGLRRNVLIGYIEAKKAESIPSLRELVETANLTERSRLNVRRELERSIAILKNRNKTNDVAEITAFLNEMKQAEQPKEKGVN